MGGKCNCYPGRNFVTQIGRSDPRISIKLFPVADKVEVTDDWKIDLQQCELSDTHYTVVSSTVVRQKSTSIICPPTSSKENILHIGEICRADNVKMVDE